MHGLSRLLILVAVAGTMGGFGQGPLPDDLGPAEFYRPPQLTLMTGFIKDPQHTGYTVEEWARGIGKNFDAEQLVSRCHRAGVAQIIWYDKWIDGLVFHHTKTTSFRTERDFLADLAPACKRHGIKLVIYFNTFYDGNPEFAQWACRDQRGRPISFSPFWPLNMLSIYSPFREKALEQIGELLEVYDVDGIWLDVPSYTRFSHDRWTREAFQRQFGKPLEEASPGERQRFAIESVVNWNREVAAFVRGIKPAAVVTTNHLMNPLQEGPLSAAGMAEPVDYFSTECHTLELQLERVPVLSEFTKPAEVGTLISDDWFSPLHSGPLKSSKSPDEMSLEAAAVLGGGVNLYLALALGRDGTTDEDTLRLLDQVGNWLKKRRPYLTGTENFADVGIALGTVKPRDVFWPGGSSAYEGEISALEENLRRHGHLVRRLLNSPHLSRWEKIGAGTRTVVVPDRESLSAADAGRIDEFVRGGGKVVAFGRGMALAGSNGTTTAAAMFGVDNAGPILAGRGDMPINVRWAGHNAELLSSPLYLQPRSAEVLLWGTTRREGQIPLLTRNRAGRGYAYAVAVPEEAILGTPELAAYIWREVIGAPLWRLDGRGERYVVRIRRQRARLIVHFMDTLTTKEGPMNRYRPAYARLSLNTEFVPFSSATVVPDNRPLKVSSQGRWKSFQVYANPELTIVLE